jgi:Protein of unknown function (DUF3304)
MTKLNTVFSVPVGFRTTYKADEISGNEAVKLCGDPSVCGKQVFIGIFFDGTQNNKYHEPASKNTNVMSALTRIALRLVLPMFLICGLTGCKAQHDVFLDGACVTMSNHTPERISTAYVNGVWIGGTTGFVLGGGGGGGFCGVMLPEKWHEGLTVNVKWTNAELTPHLKKMLNAEEIWHEQTVPVPPYKNLNEPIVHFMPDGTVKMTMNLEPYQLPPDLTRDDKPKGWRESENYYCEHIKLLTMTPKQCEKRFIEYDKTGQ